MSESKNVQLVRGGAKDRYVVRRRFDSAVFHLERARYQLAQAEVGPCEYDYLFGTGIARLLRLLGRVKGEIQDLRRTTYARPEARAKVEEKKDRMARWKAARQAARVGTSDLVREV